MEISETDQDEFVSLRDLTDDERSIMQDVLAFVHHHNVDIQCCLRTFLTIEPVCKLAEAARDFKFVTQ